MSLQGDEIEIPSVSPKANTLNRFIAKFLDLLIISAIGQIPLKVSFLAALSYLLISDGLAGGRSLGKQIIGLQVISAETGDAISFKESIIRNMTLALAFFFTQIPYVGWLLAVLVLGFESLLLIGNPRGRRVGDELAKTQILDYTVFETFKK
ncbi:MAG: RDD family protein [Nitrospiria bacterium]